MFWIWYWIFSFTSLTLSKYSVMRLYSLQKWFFDVLMHQNTYIYFYITELRFLSLKLSRFNLHYQSDKNKTSVSKQIKLDYNDTVTFIGSSGKFSNKDGHFSVIQNIGNTNIELNYKNINRQNIDPHSSQFIKNKNGVIDWIPILTKSHVEGTIKLGSKYIPMNNYNGYVDYVHTDIFPIKNPVSELYWGRLHSNDIDLTYSIVYVKNEKKYYSSCICRINNNFIRTDKCNLIILKKDWSSKLNLEYPRIISMDFYFNSFHIVLSLEQGKKLVESGVFDEQQNMNHLFVKFLKWISKNPRGIKFLSKGEVEIKESNSIKVLGSQLISEYIRFGKE